ncbi:MAG: LacI family transcriptional regulator [Spirochaetes bacterium]|nr:MAG: LacI family transcriptional regulator [Spirochaetota bacterium]
MNGIHGESGDALPEIVTADFEAYLTTIIHQWLKTLTGLGFTLVPFFFILDYVTAPRELAFRFGLYRLICTGILLLQYLLIRNTKPAKLSYLHGYFVSFNVGGVIALMTVDLGGFGSPYYAGLNLVMIAVNMLLPWKPIHSIVNSSIILVTYTFLNAVWGGAFIASDLANHLFFMSATAVIAVSINWVRLNLIKKEFLLRSELKKARDALWGEMEIAKRIQTALLPSRSRIGCQEDGGCFDIASLLVPAAEVGGDYFDIIETSKGERWITIGDVSGHGVESGLIMMMTQTSISTIVHNTAGYKPSVILNAINTVIKENISRLGADHYMSVTVIRLNQDNMLVAGLHQDILIYRASLKKVEVVPTKGTWIGIVDRIKEYTEDMTVPVEVGDIILLFTDGVTEATNEKGAMYGQDRLKLALIHYAELPVSDIVNKIFQDISGFSRRQYDDITLFVMRRDS